MSVSPPSVSLRLLLIDEDPLFRLGMGIWLNQLSDMMLVAEASDGDTALQLLDRQFESGNRALGSASGQAELQQQASQPINLILLDVGLGRLNPSQIQGLNLCRLLKSRYPALPILCLSDVSEPVIETAARQSGASGYCSKHLDSEALAAAIRRVAAGQPYFTAPVESRADSARLILPKPALPKPAPRPAPRSVLPKPKSQHPASLRLESLLRRLRLSGLEQIEATLNEVAAELQNLDLSLLDRAVLAGRSRELRAARWIVKGLLATPNLDASARSSAPRGVAPEIAKSAASESRQQSRPFSPSEQAAGSLVPVDQLPVKTAAKTAPVRPDAAGRLERQDLSLQDSRTQSAALQELALEALTAKLQSGLTNLTELPLEIDILREDKKRELLYLAMRKLEDLLDELRYSQITPAQLPEKRMLVLLDLWQAMLVDFFGKYYTVRLWTPSGEIDVELLEVLLRDAPVVQAAILDKIPAVVELLQHLLFQQPLAVDSRPYPSGNPESLARAELLLENLVIQLANAVMQPLLNHFASVEAIKSSFYDRRLLSSREIERFRNNLSWRYRLERLYGEPKNIFESQHQLFTLTGRGIRQTLIYAPRTAELAELSGLPYVLTLVLETRDAVAPRLRAVLSFMGNSFVYVLTELLGRGIGLVGRGVLKGLGNVWQDPRTGRDRQR